MEEGLTSALENFLLNNHSDRELSKGQEYMGEFTSRMTTHNQIVGVTKGRYGNYNSRISLDGKHIFVDCDCPSTKLVCHHAIGLALTYLNFSETFLSMDTIACRLKELKKEMLVNIIYKIIQNKPQSLILIEKLFDADAG